MERTDPVERGTNPDDASLEAMFVPDMSFCGRQYARFARDFTPLHPVLNDLRRTGNGDLRRGDVAEAARGWGVTEDEVRAGIRFYERHQAIFDAFFLMQAEEWGDYCDDSSAVVVVPASEIATSE